MMSDPRHDAAWSFETARFFVGFYAEPEELDPADSFEFEADIAAVRNGDVEWFAASVKVFFKPEADAQTWEWDLIGSDHLGGCAYNSIREFITGHRDPDPMNRNCSIMRVARGDNVSICHYFPSMVHEAVADARSYLRTLKDLRVRS